MSKPHVIEQITAALAVDKQDGDEGVAGMLTEGGWIPLIASDRIRMEMVHEAAERVAKSGQMLVRIVTFTVREEIARYDYRPDNEKN